MNETPSAADILLRAYAGGEQLSREDIRILMQEIAKDALADDEQWQKCLRGQHEAAAIIEVDGANSVTTTIKLMGYICKHCRCLYVERS